MNPKNRRPIRLGTRGFVDHLSRRHPMASVEQVRGFRQGRVRAYSALSRGGVAKQLGRGIRQTADAMLLLPTFASNARSEQVRAGAYSTVSPSTHTVNGIRPQPQESSERLTARQSDRVRLARLTSRCQCSSHPADQTGNSKPPRLTERRLVEQVASVAGLNSIVRPCH